MNIYKQFIPFTDLPYTDVYFYKITLFHIPKFYIYLNKYIKKLIKFKQINYYLCLFHGIYPQLSDISVSSSSDFFNPETLFSA